MADIGVADPLDLREEGGALVLRLSGRWTLDTVRRLDRELRATARRPIHRLVVEAEGLTGLDSAGAWAIRRTLEQAEARGAETELRGLSDAYRPILDKAVVPDPRAPVAPPSRTGLLAPLEGAGRAVLHAAHVGRNLAGFFGYTLVTLGGVLVRPWRLRVTATVAQMEATGLNALPIVGLLCFLVGIVLAYMGALQLKQFGADILTVNLVGVAVLREIGILLAAIIVAGRSGSAFAAQIGTMKVNQEVDALETMGLSAVEVLVLPRLIALIIVMPLLTVWADAAGLLGGSVVALFLLDLSFAQFLTQLKAAVSFWDFGTGMLKAPVFALVIALVGCYDGLRVSGSAESVGRYTTRAVVESIFLVIVLDALFAVAFAEIGI
ncbi:MlaE family lipid ABC transporter permease subunit [Thalassobaculum salexigens]|uniref:MlaE family lipid ABC transporter permease subunit n=1 Tax=Thalassobaculum salexigens TaxID=455360 RepID=UPI000416E472|nr:MlaE family lipid ABC transporter permease subunit [Thalassobaculum salexigens]